MRLRKNVMSDDNASYMDTAEQALWAIPAPDWDQWKSQRRARIWQAAALISECSPEALASPAEKDRLDTLFGRTPQSVSNLIALAKANIGTGLLKAAKLDISSLEDSEVDLSVFTTWANSIGVKLPEGFPWQPEMNLAITGWPWGRYETDLLRKLALAADRFWKNYDPSDPSTAPTNEQVSTWLKGQGVATRIAEVVASILRADGLPTGPRK